jgi:tetratricopeptide (TPR) repeat protein
VAEHVRVADALRRGLEHLRAGRPEPAFEALDEVVNDRGFREAPDLADVAARAWSLRGQAALQSQRFDEAERSAREALRRVRALGDSEGIAEVTELLALVTERRRKTDGPADAIREKLRATELADLVAIRDPVARTEALLRKCQSSLEDADRPTVLAAAELAWREGGSRGDVRAQVLARLTAAHADPESASEHLEAATAAVASGGSEVHSLVGAIARTASLLGVALPVQLGPETRKPPAGAP